jgi:hypothetical protein
LMWCVCDGMRFKVHNFVCVFARARVYSRAMYMHANALRARTRTQMDTYMHAHTSTRTAARCTARWHWPREELVKELESKIAAFL